MGTPNKVNVTNLKRQFERIGARLEVTETEATRRVSERRRFRRRGSDRGVRVMWSPTSPFAANVRTDEFGEHFTLQIGDNSQIPQEELDRPLMDPSKIQVLDVQPKDRHLVLQVVLGERHGSDTENFQVDKFLMGHDERHWFMARVDSGVTTVQQARDDLKPELVREREKRVKVKRSKRNKRRNEAFVRQGEWFFMPTDFIPGKKAIIGNNEPLIRGGGGKPHIAEEACRVGGTTVMVNRVFAPDGVTMDEYNKLRNEKKDDKDFLRSGSWSALTRDATVYVRGKIRHPDHKTLKLKGWHQVVPNTEQRRVNGRVTTMTFLD